MGGAYFFRLLREGVGLTGRRKSTKRTIGRGLALKLTTSRTATALFLRDARFRSSAIVLRGSRRCMRVAPLPRRTLNVLRSSGFGLPFGAAGSFGVAAALALDPFFLSRSCNA